MPPSISRHGKRWFWRCFFTRLSSLKRELLRLPLLGWYFSKAGCIAVDRSAARALRKLRRCRRRRVERVRSDFPAGTGIPGVEHRYEIGVFALYEATGLPVVPVALNSGHVWGRNSWLKRPGRIDVVFLAPIEPGLSRRDFMERLETAIETRMAELDAPYLPTRQPVEESVMDGSQGRPEGQKNVLGGTLQSCSHDPLTGFFRDGCCHTGPHDQGLHTVCAIMTDEFLEFSKNVGNDLSTPMPQFGFPGLKDGDQGAFAQAAGNRPARQATRRRSGFSQPTE